MLLQHVCVCVCVCVCVHVFNCKSVKNIHLDFGQLYGPSGNFVSKPFLSGLILQMWLCFLIIIDQNKTRIIMILRSIIKLKAHTIIVSDGITNSTIITWCM